MQLSNTFKKYLSNTSWLFAEKIIRMVVGFSVGVWVTRYLGPERLGILSYAQSFVFLFSAFATLGLNGIVVRELVKHPDKRDVLLGTSFVLKFGGALIALTFLSLAIYFTDTESSTAIIVMLIGSATVFQAFNVIDFYFQSQALNKYVVFAQAGAMVVTNGIKIGMIINEATLIWFAAVSVFEISVISVSLLGYYLKKGINPKKWYFQFDSAKNLLKDSWPLILSGIALTLQARVDQIMMESMVGVKEVGYYSVAIRFIELFAFLPMVLKTSITPLIISSQNSPKNYQFKLLNYYRLSFILFLIIGIPVYFFSEKIITTVFGSEYLPAGILLSLLAIRLFFANMGVARGIFILSENLLRYSVITMIIGTASNILLNFYLIPIYQAKGAIFATIISFFITIFAIDLFYIKTRKNTILIFNGIFTFYKFRITEKA
jgi:O-antigen/teichoic acid export membrane protein